MKFPKRTLLLLLPLLVLTGFFPVYAHAGDIVDTSTATGLITGFMSNVIAKVVYVINYMLGMIAGTLLALGGLLISFALGLNQNILNADTNVFLYTGWNIILSLADLALVLSIIVIAFATMLQFESYGMKKTLIRLIVVALLINFSLAIPGVVIDAGNSLTQFLSDKITKNNVFDMGAVLAGSFNAQKFLAPSNCYQSGGSGLGDIFKTFSNDTVASVASVFFVVIFTGTAAIVLLMIFVMLLYRYIALSLILMFSPLLMVAWIFPPTKMHFTKYLSEFFRWVFFAPATLFFVYLSVITLQKLNTGKNFFEGFASAGSAEQALCKSLTFGVDTVGQMVMAVGLLVASLTVANSFSLQGGKGVISWAQKTSESFRGGVGKWAQRQGTKMATYPTTRAQFGQKATDWMQGAGLGRGRIGKFITKPIRELGYGAQYLGKGQADKLLKQATDRQKDLSWSDLIKRYGGMSADEKVTALQRLEKEGKLGNLAEKYPKLLDEMMSKSMEKTGSMESMLTKYGKIGLGDNKFFESVENGVGKSKKMLLAEEELEKKSKPALPVYSGDTNTFAAEMKKYKDSLPATDWGKANEEVRKATEEFYARRKPEDYGKIDPKALTDPTFGNLATEFVLLRNPGALGGIMSKANDKDLEEKLIPQLQKISGEITSKVGGKLDETIKRLDKDLLLKKLDLAQEKDIQNWLRKASMSEKAKVARELGEDDYKKIKVQVEQTIGMNDSLQRRINQRIWGKFGGEEEEKKEEENK